MTLRALPALAFVAALGLAACAKTPQTAETPAEKPAKQPAAQQTGGQAPAAQEQPGGTEATAPKPAETQPAGPIRTRSAEAIEKELLEAYGSGSDRALKSFFENWDAEVPPADVETLDDPVVRDVHDVFAAFYTPHRIGRIGHSEWGDDIYAETSFVIVQDSIRYQIGEKGEEKTIEDFRPPVRPAKGEAVHLTPAYSKALETFLGSEHHPMGTGNIMNPAQAKGESKKRLEFLNRMVKIHHGHWGGWHLATHPYARTIVFDEDRTRALVHFRIVYEGGEAVFEKEGDAWVLRSSGLTWIE